MDEEFSEIVCADCGENYYAAEYPSNQLSHCLICGGVNVRAYTMYLESYIENERPDLFMMEEYDRNQLWDKIKNLNTDEEIREIEDMLFK